jgi:hypothetical protein
MYKNHKVEPIEQGSRLTVIFQDLLFKVGSVFYSYTEFRTTNDTVNELHVSVNRLWTHSHINK